MQGKSIYTREISDNCLDDQVLPPDIKESFFSNLNSEYNEWADNILASDLIELQKILEGQWIQLGILHHTI